MDVSDATTDAAAPPDIAQIDCATLPECPLQTSPPAGDDFFVIVAADARTAMERHARSRRDVEVGGVLLGRACQVNGRPFLLIDAIIPAMAAESRDVNVTFTADTWTQIHSTLDAEHPGAAIVGWYHTHPNFGIFLSEMDVFIQRHFFDLPHQVAVVIDPVANEEGVFVWRDGVPTRSTLHTDAAGSEGTAPPPAEPPAALSPFAGALAFARDELDDDLPPIDFISAVRQRIAERDAHRPVVLESIGDLGRTLINELRDLNPRQWFALSALLLLVGLILAATIYAVVAGSAPHDAVPISPTASSHDATAPNVRE